MQCRVSLVKPNGEGTGGDWGGTSCIPLSPLDKGHKTQLEVFVASAVIHVGWRACLGREGAGGWGGGWRVGTDSFILWNPHISVSGHEELGIC